MASKVSCHCLDVSRSHPELKLTTLLNPFTKSSLDFSSSALSAHVIFFYLVSRRPAKAAYLSDKFEAAKLWQSICSFTRVRQIYLVMPIVPLIIE